MKLLRIGPAGGERPAAIDSAGRLVDLSGVTGDIDGVFLSGDGPALVRAALVAGDLPVLAPDGLRIGAPVARPGKVVCIGLNYRDHAAETGAKLPAEPVIFFKDPGTVIGPNDEVLIPRLSQQTDWEVELAVVIGRRARHPLGTRCGPKPVRIRATRR